MDRRKLDEQKGSNTTVTIITVLIGVIVFGSNNNTSPDYGKYRINIIKELAEKHSLDEVNLDTILNGKHEDFGLSVLFSDSSHISVA